MHTADPTSLLYVPATQALQATPSESAVYAATHLQSVNALLLSADRVFAGHPRHETAPNSLLYSPAWHGVHSPSPTVFLYVPTPHVIHERPLWAIVCPTSHLQSARLVLPTAELVRSGHAVHNAGPIASLYVPTGHASQSPPRNQVAVRPGSGS